MAKPPAAENVSTLENLLAPELYATDTPWFSTNGSTVTVTFTSLRWDNSRTPPQKTHVVIARLVMPIVGAQNLAAGLYDYLKKNGFDPAPIPGETKGLN